MSDDPATVAPTEKSRRGVRWYLENASTLVGLGVLGWLLASDAFTHETSTAWGLAIFLLAWTAQTLAHELGHLLASRVVGFRFVSIAVFPIRLSHGPQGWYFGLSWETGQCLACPTDARDLRRRCIVYFLGGPVGGLIAAAVCALIVWRGAVLGWPTMFFRCCADLGLIISLVNLIPMDGMEGRSDGSCLNILRKPGPQAEQFAATLAIQLLDASGVRYRDMDPALIAALDDPASSPGRQSVAHYAAYLAAIDAGRVYDARPLLDRLSELTAGTPEAPDTALELAYFVAAHEGNAPEARCFFDRAEGQGSPCARDMAEAAILLAEGRPGAARAVLDALPDGFVDLAREGTATMRLIADQIDDLVARAGVAEQTS